MPRSRNIKHALFKNELLGEADPIYTVLFVGLWTLADKKGRLEYRPKKIKAEIFPYRFDLDPCLGLAWLNDNSFITVYEFNNEKFIQINNWHKHQSPHHKEADSIIPPPSEGAETALESGLAHERLKHGSSMDQAWLNEVASSPLIPDSLIPDSLGSQSEIEPPKKNPSLLIQSIEESWARNCPNLPQPKIWNEKRKKLLKARIKEDPERTDPEWWDSFFDFIGKQPFLNGDNQRGWTANIDFVLSSDGMTRIIEGNYENVKA